jgi:hypothetical protein
LFTKEKEIGGFLHGFKNKSERPKDIDNYDKLAGGTNVKKRTKVYG